MHKFMTTFSSMKEVLEAQSEVTKELPLNDIPEEKKEGILFTGRAVVYSKLFLQKNLQRTIRHFLLCLTEIAKEFVNEDANKDLLLTFAKLQVKCEFFVGNYSGALWAARDMISGLKKLVTF